MNLLILILAGLAFMVVLVALGLSTLVLIEEIISWMTRKKSV